MFARSLFCLSFFSFAALAADIDTQSALKEDPSVPLIEDAVTIPLSVEETKKWKLGHMQVFKDGQAIFEWIHPDDAIEDWSELIQIQILPFDKTRPKQSAEEFSKIFMDILRTQFSHCKASIISQKDNEVVLEFSLPKVENGEDAQSEIAKIVANDKGIIRIAFTTKSAPMKEELKKKWADRLTNAQVFKANQ